MEMHGGVGSPPGPNAPSEKYGDAWRGRQHGDPNAPSENYGHIDRNFLLTFAGRLSIIRGRSRIYPTRGLKCYKYYTRL